MEEYKEYHVTNAMTSHLAGTLLLELLPPTLWHSQMV
jgi:hypothetical protein